MLLKFCGITNKEDLRAAEIAGAGYVGFILVPGSPRCVSRATAKELIGAASVKTVCVVRDMPLEELNECIRELHPDVIQLHGGETPEYASGISGAEVWKAVCLTSEKALREAEASPCSVIVADSGGGTGRPCCWELAAGLARKRTIFLAGGLTPENVCEAVRRVRPAGVDVSGGVERRPGIKDKEKMFQFSERIRFMNTHYGIYGGAYVAETLTGALRELEQAYIESQSDPSFRAELEDLLTHYVGRESPLYFARRLTEHCGGARIYLKREDLNHTGAHKINNTIGQALLARRMGKKRLIAETGAGMHGVATATVAALFGMECEIFMGAVDVARQAPNVERMHALGAKVRSITEGGQTLKDAMNAALREWTASSADTFYLIGTAAGPYPYPAIVRDFQSVIGRETRRQCLEQAGRLPDEVVACVGGGSNAIGMFAGFLDDPEVRLVGAEAGGLGLDTGKHAASINGGQVGILHGMKAYFLQDENGQMLDTHSVSAGLDYSGVGPEHCFMADSGRARYTVITDREAVDAFDALCRLEGIIPALESSHALAQGMKDAAGMKKDQIVVVNLSGRGDKDMENIKNYKANHGQTF